MSQDDLRRANTLIEQGNLEEARQLLQTLDDPTARQWLAQLNARRRPQRPPGVVPLPWLIAIAAVIGIAALLIILLLTPTLLARMQNSPNTASADATLNTNLVSYCQSSLGSGREESCRSWAEQVVSRYHGVAAACLTQFGVDTPAKRAQVSACLTQNNVPPPA